MGDEVSVLGGHGQLKTGRVAPVGQLIGQQLHGHLFIVLIGLVQELVGQLAKLPVEKVISFY